MKSGEIDYLKNIGAQGSQDAFDKPFSDATRPKNLVDIGIVMALLPQPPAARSRRAARRLPTNPGMVALTARHRATR
jgi:hypothetical protein